MPAILASLVLWLASPVSAQGLFDLPTLAELPGLPTLSEPAPLLPPIRSSAYGPGLHADGAGRPFVWQPEGAVAIPDPTLTVTPNQYGIGNAADQYGRVVQPVPLSPWGPVPYTVPDYSGASRTLPGWGWGR
jgi:hypothetical protein